MDNYSDAVFKGWMSNKRLDLECCFCIRALDFEQFFPSVTGTFNEGHKILESTTDS